MNLTNGLCNNSTLTVIRRSRNYLSCNKTIAYQQAGTLPGCQGRYKPTYDKSQIIFFKYRQINKLIIQDARASQTRILNAIGIDIKHKFLTY